MQCRPDKLVVIVDWQLWVAVLLRIQRSIFPEAHAAPRLGPAHEIDRVVGAALVQARLPLAV